MVCSCLSFNYCYLYLVFESPKIRDVTLQSLFAKLINIKKIRVCQEFAKITRFVVYGSQTLHNSLSGLLSRKTPLHMA